MVEALKCRNGPTILTMKAKMIYKTPHTYFDADDHDSSIVFCTLEVFVSARNNAQFSFPHIKKTKESNSF